MLCEEYSKLQRKIERFKKLENEIHKDSAKLSEQIKSRTYFYNNEECYPSYISYEYNMIHLLPTKYFAQSLITLQLKNSHSKNFLMNTL